MTRATPTTPSLALPHPSRALVRSLWTAVVLLTLLGMFAAVRRAFHLTLRTERQPFPGAAVLDAGFVRHPIVTLVHIIPGFVFMLLGPLQFVPWIRNRHLRLHRRLGTVYLCAGAVIGISALSMSFLLPIGGANEAAATVLFATFFLFALGKAYVHIRAREIGLHREWMIRAFAIGLAVATIRPIVGVFFALSRVTHQTPQEFFGTAFWIGFTLHMIAAEAWINYTRAAAYPRNSPASRLATGRS